MGVIVLNRIINLGPKKKAFSACTWAEVSEICKAGLASEYWQIGDTKNMVDGDDTTALRIIGFDHDPVADSAAYGREMAGITLEMVGLHNDLKSVRVNTTNYAGTAWYSTQASQKCKLRTETLPNFLSARVPTDLKNVIVSVKKEGSASDVNGFVANREVNDTLFVLSANEITGKYASGAGSEGEQYAYYKAGNSYDKGVSYWTRSPVKSGGMWYYISGASVYQTYVTEYKGCFPCMCI